MRYSYNLAPAWMDPTSATVKYEVDSRNGKAITNSQKSTYIEVPQIKVVSKGNVTQVGQYFVPLNTKQTDTLKYNLDPDINRRPIPISVGLCNSIIDKYPTKADGKEFWGDYLTRVNGKDLIYDSAKTAEAAKNVIKSEGGCRMRLHVTFQIVQEFYNEDKKFL